MVTLDEVYEFCRKHYKACRFEESDMIPSCPEYPVLVATSTFESLQEYGHAYFSRYETASGRVMKFDADLNIIPLTKDGHDIIPT